MALWPFRRKSGRKRTRSGAALSDVEGPPRSQTADAAVPVPTKRTPSQKKQRTETEPAKLHRRPRTYSFSPGRHDSIRVDGKGTSAQPTAVRGKRFSPGDQIDEVREGDSQWQRVPTLYGTRNGDKMSRRKSSKRRRDDHDREAELKAMSNFVPVRPSAEAWTAGRPMKKDSKRVRTGGRGSGAVSEVSLPIPDSIHSSMSSDSEHASYRISALEALAPRPTLRYATHPRWAPGNSTDPTRSTSQRNKLAERANLPEATLKSHKRIDSLADDLGASDLRELMERDNRRRERKRQREQEHTERRLARRAEKQREAEVEASKSGTPPPQNLERGVMGRDVVGLGIDTTSAVVTSSRRRSSDASFKRQTPSPEQGHASPERETTAEEALDTQIEPLSHFHRTTSIPLETALESETEVVAPATPPPETTKRATSIQKKSRSRTSLASDERHRLSPTATKTEEYDPPRKDSESSNRGKLNFSSLFKWGSRGNHRSSGPSSFSNTSREEMQAAIQAQGLAPTHSAQQAQATSRTSLASTPPPVAGYTPTKMSSGVPKRTRSRFREDLPELPMSPPDSRVASPETEPPMPAVSERHSREQGDIEASSMPVRYDTPSSERRTIDETMRQTPTSVHRLNQHSPQPQSVSLASIDSEASWLSGRVGKRSSSGLGMRDSNPRYPYAQQRQSQQSSSGNNTEEEIDEQIADDEYLSNLATLSHDTNMAQTGHGRRSTGDGRPSSDEDEHMADADMKWGSVSARQTVMHRRQAARIKSSEGLLNTFDEESSSSSDLIETPMVESVTRVSYGKKGHVRHMSAGSAKLLDITPRASIDSKGRNPTTGDRRSSVPLSS